MPNKGSSSTKVAKSRPVLKQLRITEELYDEIELRADVTGEKVNDLVRRLLIQYCEGPFERPSDMR